MVVQAERRVSARIQQKQREEKLRLVKRRVELLGRSTGEVDDDDDDEITQSSSNASSKRGRKVEIIKEEEKISVETTTSGAELANGVVPNVVEKSDHAKVKDTLRLFNKYYLHEVQVWFYFSQICIKLNCLDNVF